ncbi:Fc.00g038440.m01.CDS01 [Cosmosporella sp. VM-42]
MADDVPDLDIGLNVAEDSLEYDAADDSQDYDTQSGYPDEAALLYPFNDRRMPATEFGKQGGRLTSFKHVIADSKTSSSLRRADRSPRPHNLICRSLVSSGNPLHCV